MSLLCFWLSFLFYFAFLLTYQVNVHFSRVVSFGITLMFFI